MNSLLIPEKRRGFSSCQTSLPMKDTRVIPIRKRRGTMASPRPRKPARSPRSRGFSPAQKAIRAFNILLMLGLAGVGVNYALLGTLSVGAAVLIVLALLAGGGVLLTDTP
jgi:hypothetical protein